MSMTAAQILTAAQALPPQERETLCTKIAESLDAPLTPEEQPLDQTVEVMGLENEEDMRSLEKFVGASRKLRR